MKSDCICQWKEVKVAGSQHRVMRTRDAACPNHGDGTFWWDEQKRIARALSAERIAADDDWRPE